jgi:hypothetical protein
LVSNIKMSGAGVKTSVSNTNIASRLLRSVAEQEGFNFYIALGEPIGKTAISLADFAEKMADVDVRSVNFHYPRKDFEKWIFEVIGDTKLASRLNLISRMHIGIKGEALRNQIIRAVKVRLSEIEPSPPAITRPPILGSASPPRNTT